MDCTMMDCTMMDCTMMDCATGSKQKECVVNDAVAYAQAMADRANGLEQPLQPNSGLQFRPAVHSCQRYRSLGIRCLGCGQAHGNGNRCFGRCDPACRLAAHKGSKIIQQECVA